MRGGASSEYELSLKSGAKVLSSLPEEAYEARDIFIDRSGLWHLRGLPVPPARALQQVDVVFNALHSGMGDDGSVQRFLDMNGVPFTGSRADGAASSHSKIRTHEILEKVGVPMPHSLSFMLTDKMNTADMSRQVHARFAPPYVVKAPREGGSVGIRIVRTVMDLPGAIADTLDAYGSALVEQFVIGEHVVAGVIEGFRREDVYVLPAAHVKLPGQAKSIEPHHYQEGSLRYVVPSRFSHEEKERIADLARRAHTALGMRHFSSVDLIKTRNSIVVLEVDATPGLYDGASFPSMLESVGSSMTEFLDHSIRLARSGR